MKSLTERAARTLAPTSFEPLGLEVVKADGIYLYDPNGKAYIDMISGISVSNLGHGNKEVNAAIAKQLTAHSHIMVLGEMFQPSQIEFAEKLTALLPDGLDSVYFVNSGSEAVEGAMKLAKRYTGRPNIIALNKAYHGSTHGALSLMGDEFFKGPFRPLLPGVSHIEPNDLEHLKYIDETVAAVFVEPLQGEAGVVELTSEYLNKLRARCTETGTMLVFDEIQTGIGRTGDLFYFESTGITPDILLTAKALGGGMPLGAFISSIEVMKSFAENPVLGHITTFGGHPVCCAAGNAALNFLLNSKLMDEVPAKEKMMRDILVHPDVLEIRGKGLLLAVQFENYERLQKAIDRALELGVVIDWFLFCDSAMRLAPPLTITLDELKNACELVLQAIKETSNV